ncbi:MAG: DUF2182 domain-containing protein [Defluviicoccus sp.]|nr:DUF2182 domain-containing protein [Defluviicoccus sp.]MDE0384621.1 DUF2182 domain-containing protein [Defluviicoccus sp.]
MTGEETLRAALRRLLRRAPILAALGLVLAASWGFVAWMTLDMAHPLVRLAMPMDAAWSWATAVAVLAMWAGMMFAMMLPSAAPMILAFDTVERGDAGGGGAAPRTLAFAGGYLLVWVGYSALAAGAQWEFQASGLLTPMIVSRSDWLTGGLLALAGLYQWTPLKEACLRHCRTPLGFLMAEWRDGVQGALAMGLKHGLYCAGCCWALMLLLFVAGVMNPVWIVFLTVLVALEKWPVLPAWVARLFGAILIGAGAAILV